MKHYFVPLASLVFMVGCVPSIHPLHSPDTVEFLPELIGLWSDGEGQESWRFEDRGKGAYTFTVTGEGEKDDEATAEFVAHVVKLGEFQFLDALLVRASGEFSGLGMARCAMVIRPAHLIFRLTGPEPELKLVMLNPDRLQDILEDDPKALAHESLREPDVEDQRVLLTASTPELQAFFREHAADDELFDIEGAAALRKVAGK